MVAILTHLPNVSGAVRLIQYELSGVFVVLALNAKEAFVVDQVCDVVPFEKLRTQHVSPANHNAR